MLFSLWLQLLLWLYSTKQQYHLSATSLSFSSAFIPLRSWAPLGLQMHGCHGPLLPWHPPARPALCGHSPEAEAVHPIPAGSCRGYGSRLCSTQLGRCLNDVFNLKFYLLNARLHACFSVESRDKILWLSKIDPENYVPCTRWDVFHAMHHCLS